MNIPKSVEDEVLEERLEDLLEEPLEEEPLEEEPLETESVEVITLKRWPVAVAASKTEFREVRVVEVEAARELKIERKIVLYL